MLFKFSGAFMLCQDSEYYIAVYEIFNLQVHGIRDAVGMHPSSHTEQAR